MSAHPTLANLAWVSGPTPTAGSDELDVERAEVSDVDRTDEPVGEHPDATRAHLAGCRACQATVVQLAELDTQLAADPAPAQPAGLADRLQAVIARESAHRAAGVSTLADHRSARPGLGDFGADRRVSKRGPFLWGLAAAILAAVVGFGGYVISSASGGNEPTLVAARIDPGHLAQEAESLEHGQDVDPHRFSRAWLCARQVTEGRITGLAETTLSSEPALLVYLRVSGADRVVVVTGCNTGTPVAGPSAALR